MTEGDSPHFHSENSEEGNLSPDEQLREFRTKLNMMIRMLLTTIDDTNSRLNQPKLQGILTHQGLPPKLDIDFILSPQFSYKQFFTIAKKNIEASQRYSKERNVAYVEKKYHLIDECISDIYQTKSKLKIQDQEMSKMFEQGKKEARAKQAAALNKDYEPILSAYQQNSQNQPKPSPDQTKKSPTSDAPKTKSMEKHQACCSVM